METILIIIVSAAITPVAAFARFFFSGRIISKKELFGYAILGFVIGIIIAILRGAS